MYQLLMMPIEVGTARALRRLMLMAASAPFLLTGQLLALPLLAISAAQAQQIDEIVVTARRREESAQDVPLSFTAISSAEIQNRGIKDISGVVQVDPSV